MRILISWFLVLGSCGFLLAQPGKYTTTNSKAIKHFESAMKHYQARENKDAEEDLLKALDKDPNFVEAYHLMANIYVEAKQFEKAAEQYEKSFVINPGFFPNSYYTVANIYFTIGKYAEAKKHYEKFITFPTGPDEFRYMSKKNILNCEYAVDAIKHPVPFSPVNMGEKINTMDHEYFPSITADGKTLFFTRNLKDNQAVAGYQEDFYLSKQTGAKEWGLAGSMGPPINTTDNEGAPSISADGQIIIYAGCNRPDGKGSCDIYYSRKIGNKWSTPVNIGPPINTKNWETQPSFSSDGKTLYFIRGTVTREGIKNQDIYYSQLSKEGYWEEPVPIGGKINTPDREESVFIHPDNQTLYFSSNGHIGMGGLDIYMSKRQPNGEWGKPVNLGYPINTNNDENSLLVSPSGDIAYFASNRQGGKGGLDLYQFDLYQDVRPEKITYVNGKVFDALSNKPIGATFELIDLETARVVIESESNIGNGEFLISLTANKNYALNVSKNGYLFYSENFSLKEAADLSTPFQLDIPLQPIGIGTVTELKNIFFETGKYDLKEESKAELQKLVDFLTLNKTVKIEIGGHTDNVGDKKQNLTLSQNRAKAVYDYLVNKGIATERLSYMGYGDAQPKFPNDTPENRAKNRRTEFKVTAK